MHVPPYFIFSSRHTNLISLQDKIENVLGSGGFATVYKVSLAGAPHKTYAMKVCHPMQGHAAQISQHELEMLKLVASKDPHGVM